MNIHRANKQNEYIKIIIDRKQYDRIQIKQEQMLANDKKLQANKHDKTQIIQNQNQNYLLLLQGNFFAKAAKGQ